MNLLHPKVCAAGVGLFASATTEPLRVGVSEVTDMVSGLLSSGIDANQCGEERFDQATCSLSIFKTEYGEAHACNQRRELQHVVP
jgi:hypothetical protein